MLNINSADNEVGEFYENNDSILSYAMDLPFGETVTQSHVQVEKDFDTMKKKVSNDIIKKKLSRKLCKCTDINVAEVLLLLMTVGMKHSLTWVALLDIFEVLNYVFKKKVFPVTKYLLKQLLNVNNENITNHIICDNCNGYLKKTKETNFTIKCSCGVTVNSSTVGSFFIQIDPVQQLRKLFEDPNIYNALNERFQRNKENVNTLEDIFDGNIYKKYSKNSNQLENLYNFSYTFNTDGCQSSDTSKVTIWPIFMMIHEFPIHLRKKCMPLLGLWVAKKEPDMKVFLQPFVDEANELSTEGFSWNYCGKNIISKLFPIGCCVDSPARSSMLNMKRFNGIYGCTYCEHPTESVDGIRKYTMLNEPPTLRTDNSIKQKMIAVYESGKSDIMGVLGPSPLMYLKYFDLAKGMVLDFMHSCLLGVTELHMTLIMTNCKEDYYIGSPANIYLINDKLLSIKPPSCIARNPRDVRERNQWKASQWLSWLIYYSLITLQGILSEKYYNHWALFVAAMNILLADSITPEMLKEAGILLVKFVYYFEKLYGKKYMHYNIHLLLHLKDNVENWGPLWTNSTFDFENQNRILLKKKKCNNRIAQQIVSRLQAYQELPLLEARNYISDDTKNICNNIRNNYRLKIFEKIGNCNLLGSGKTRTLSNSENLYLRVFLNTSKINKCTEYFKIIYNGCRYTSCSYNQCTKTNDSVFATKNGEFGIIKNICKVEYDYQIKIIIFFNKLELKNSCIVDNADVSVKHLQLCKIVLSKDLNVIFSDDIYAPCIIMKVKNQLYVSALSKAMKAKYIN